ncbi:hypothetical protein M6B38_178540 [Iris pallida]|uniref:Uncharacterized protein n=1 Tax=Iris pallida TaxID=29817 RepID=A0AAX6ENF3_IRIPA|nr:hypothetical protein M6B38_178540 [Iris pallida]
MKNNRKIKKQEKEEEGIGETHRCRSGDSGEFSATDLCPILTKGVGRSFGDNRYLGEAVTSTNIGERRWHYDEAVALLIPVGKDSRSGLSSPDQAELR